MMRERRRRVSKWPLLFAIVLGTFVASAVAHPREAEGSVSFAASLDDLGRASTVIARVTPLDHASAWEGGRIVTYSRVRIDAIVAGSAGAAREVRIRTLGGRVGKLGQIVEGEASLTPAEPSIVFLVAASDGSHFAVVGRAQGQLVIARDVRGREIVRIGRVGDLVERSIHPPLRQPGRRISELDGAPLETVTSDVKQAFEAGHAH